MHAGVPAQTDAQQPVEAVEVIHVGVGHEDVGHPQQLFRRQQGKVPEIEQQRTLLEVEVDVDAGIAEGRIDELWIEGVTHSCWKS